MHWRGSNESFFFTNTDFYVFIFRGKGPLFPNQANLNLFLTVLSISFTTDSSFFSKVSILNSIWEKTFFKVVTHNWYVSTDTFHFNTYTIRLSIDSETSTRYAFLVRIWNFQSIKEFPVMTGSKYLRTIVCITCIFVRESVYCLQSSSGLDQFSV